MTLAGDQWQRSIEPAEATFPAAREVLSNAATKATRACAVLRDVARLKMRVPMVTQREFAADGALHVTLICLRYKVKVWRCVFFAADVRCTIQCVARDAVLLM